MEVTHGEVFVASREMCKNSGASGMNEVARNM